MDKAHLKGKIKRIIKVTAKWLFIFLSVIFTIIVIVACYLLIADFFYDG